MAEWRLPDEYVPERELGRGGMGVVVRAYHRTLQRRVAVKVLREELNDDAGWRDRMALEARLVAHVSHPNLVKVLDWGLYSSERAWNLPTLGRLRGMEPAAR